MSTSASSAATSTPLLLRIGRWVALVWGALVVLVALGIPAGITDLSQISSTYPGTAPLRIFFLVALISGAMLILISLGISRRRPWTRILIIAFWAFAQLSVAFALYQRASQHTWSLDFTSGIFMLVSVAYLFLKPNVVAYFASEPREPRTTESVA